jgi:hypothetical protein
MTTVDRPLGGVQRAYFYRVALVGDMVSPSTPPWSARGRSSST